MTRKILLQSPAASRIYPTEDVPQPRLEEDIDLYRQKTLEMNRKVARPDTQIDQWDMGEKYVDESLCTECGVCEKICPYKAIKLDPKPVFDLNECYGCWACFNRCTERAIYTRKYRGVGHYPKPLERLKEALRV